MSFFHFPAHSITRFARGIQQIGDEYPCTVSQWHRDVKGSSDVNYSAYRINHASEIADVKDASLTIIHAPLDELKPECLAGFRALVERFRITGTFVDESERRLINSFGYREENDSKSSWLRFLLKEVKQEPIGAQERPPDDGRLSRILRLVPPFSFMPNRQPKKDNAEKGSLGLRIPLQMAGSESASHAEDWTRCSFFLQVEKVEEVAHTTSAPSFTSTLEHDQAVMTETISTAGSAPRIPSLHQVTLICFDTPVDIVSELEAISTTIPLNDILEHPYILWELITYHLSAFLEEELLKLSECFGTEQKASSRCGCPEVAVLTVKQSLGYITADPLTPVSDIDFSSLHLLADHTVLVLEGAKGLYASINALASDHKASNKKTASMLARKTCNALEYRERFVQSLLERGLTFEKRIDNMINLFFHHMSLQDSGFMMRDSSSLRSIAFLTLVFLPITTVATICGSEFFYTEESSDGSPTSVRVNRSVWVMFVLSGLMTLSLMVVWKWNTERLDRQFARGITRSFKPRNVSLVL